MTTSHSPLSVIKAQADSIAAMLKAAERGDTVDAAVALKIMAARKADCFEFGIVMDDKIIIVTIPWDIISSTDEASLSEHIMKQMRNPPPPPDVLKS